MLRNSLPTALVMLGELPEYGCQFSCERKSGKLHKGKYHVRSVAGPSSDSSWQIMSHVYIHT